MNRHCHWSIVFLLVPPLSAQSQTLEVTLENGKQDFAASPIRVPLQWPKDWRQDPLVFVKSDGDQNHFAMLTEPNFVTDKIKADEGKVRKDIVLTSALKAGERMRISIAAPKGKLNDPVGPQILTRGPWCRWEDHPNDFLDLVVVSENGQKTAPVMRYMYKTYDNSAATARNKTYKVFHHLFDPSGNGKIITNGGHTDEFKNEKDLLYPHHRGLMFAFNKCQYDGKSVDTWHCTNGAHISHQKTIFQTDGITSGTLMAEHRVLLTWHGPKDEVFAEEERQMTAHIIPSGEFAVIKPPGTLIEFATRLTPKVAKLRLDGDPQHSGFQFRAHNDVAKKSAKETYYLRPDGKGKPGATRNWAPKKGGPTNLPWDVMSFVLDGKRYSVAYIDHPSNPGEKRYSERDYGRFGCYFEADLTPERPLILNHRVWLQEGEMTEAQVEALRRAFVDPPKVMVK